MTAFVNIQRLCLLLGAFLTAPLTLIAAPTLKDVKPLTENLFSVHVTESQMSPELVKRSLFLMVEGFDKGSEYLLEEEKKPFLNPEAATLALAVSQYHEGSYDTYNQAFIQIKKAIKRHRKLRKKVHQKIANKGYKLRDKPLKRGLAKLRNHAEVGAKIEKKYINLIQLKLKERGRERFSPSEIEAILSFQDALWLEHEEHYIGLDKSQFFPTLLIKNFARSMDIHSDYYSPEEAAQMRSSLNKQLCGVGVVFKRDFDGIYIASIIRGSPADECRSISEGDKIVAVDGKVIKGLSFRQVVKLMKGEKGQNITLTLEKQGQKKSVKAQMKRRPIVLNEQRVSSRYVPFADGGIGIIELPSFYSDGGKISVAEDLKQAIAHLKSQGKVLGMILDMRENPGGYLPQAVKVCKCFMPSGLVAIAKYKHNKVRFLNHLGKKPLYDGPLVILNSKMSASAAELVSQTLQDYGLAIVVGDKRTFGKGSMQTQTVSNAKAKHFFKVTIGRYYTASGRSPQVVGVLSDIVVNSHYFPYKVGEEHLTFALSPDVLTQESFDQLHQRVGRGAFGSNPGSAAQVVPYLRPRMSKMRERIKQLSSASARRLKQDANFQNFLKVGHATHDKMENRFGMRDLQMKEAEAIIKDLVMIQQ